MSRGVVEGSRGEVELLDFHSRSGDINSLCNHFLNDPSEEDTSGSAESKLRKVPKDMR